MTHVSIYASLLYSFFIMTKFLCSIFFSFFVLSASAQRSIIDELSTQRPGEGIVTVHQDPSISLLIGKRFVRTPGVDKVIRARGFRVQVYAGNNSRMARNEATEVAEKVKEEFPQMAVYTYFLPPRWLCRVGDYKSMEEAYVAMRMLKESGMFKEVAIVREQINISLE